MHQSSNKNRPDTPDNQFLLRESVSKNGSTPRGTRKGADFHEKQPLFDRPLAEPVKLTPAWEETNLPNDELNFKGVTMEQADLEINPPRDWCKLVYFTLLLHGIGVLLPWNMFINARSYFVDFKLKSNNGTDDLEQIRSNFMNYLTFAAQIPNVIFNWLNVFVHIGGNLTTRIVWSIMVEVVLFIFTVALAMTDSSEWRTTFFWCSMVTVVLLNMANGIYQNTVFGMAAKLPFKYTGAVILGTNISGVFTSILNLAARLSAPNLRTAAIYYFITALFVLLVCFDTYFALPLNRYYRYHELLGKKAQHRQQLDSRAHKPRIPYGTIIKQCWPQLYNVFFIFFVTLALFPALIASIKPNSESFFVPTDIFSDVTCFLTFNICAMLGSLLATWISWPSPEYLAIPVTLRVLFIPFFVFCNYVPHEKRVLPILIYDEYVYWVGVVIMAFTSGYFSALGMEYCPRSVEPQNTPIAGMLGGAFMITGIFCGVVFSMVFPPLVSLIAL